MIRTEKDIQVKIKELRLLLRNTKLHPIMAMAIVERIKALEWVLYINDLV